jgi:tetratricopeptide (TPR) repeat protein
MTKRTLLTGATAVGVLAILIPVVLAQARKVPPAVTQANRALLEGRYDEVAGIVQALDQNDPVVAAVKGKALIARGKYAEAETLLKPIVQKAPTSEAALDLGLLYQMLGRLPEGNPILARVSQLALKSDDAHELARAARAMQALGEYQDANSVFRDLAVPAAPKDPAIQTMWGDLFLDRYQMAEAAKSYQEAFEADGNWQPALAGAALALAGENPPQATELANRALKMNPNDVRMIVLLAQQAADNAKNDEARKLLQRALDVNPSSLEAHSMLAGLAYVEDKKAEFEAAVAKVLSISPTHGEVYRVAGEMTAHAYRFEEAAALTRKAVELRPRDAQSLADLGVHLLRTGDEAGARKALDASFELDKFSVVTFNLLQMMDTLDKFVTFQDDMFIIRLDKDEAPVLKDYVTSIAHQAINTLSKRYQFKPQGPIIIEVFPKHDDFAVRNVGLPGMIGALGACFGRVVTMDSPKARPGDPFQWEATLWHELAHVITLQMSAQRVPRWLTEGISVYEEKLHRPEWGRGMDMEFAQRLNDSQTLALKDLNSAFTDPRKIGLAYFQGSLLVEHLVSLYGDAGIQRLVRAFAKGVDTEAALKSELNTDFDRLQVTFDQAMDKKYRDLRRALELDEGVDLTKMPLDVLKKYADERPKNYPANFMLGIVARKSKDDATAMQAFERAAAAAPVAAGADSPRAQLAQMAIEKGDKARAIAELRELIKVDFDNVEAARMLAKLYREEGTKDPALLYPVYFRIVAIDPYDVDAHTMLGTLALQRNEADLAVREFTAVLALKPVDQAAAHTNLAEAFLRTSKRPEARRQILAALEIAPGYERAQDLLLKIQEVK